MPLSLLERCKVKIFFLNFKQICGNRRISKGRKAGKRKVRRKGGKGRKEKKEE